MRALLYLVIVGVAFLVIGVSYWAKTINPQWGREWVYPMGSATTKYPGFGSVTRYVGPQDLILPKGDGIPFFVTPDQAEKYDAAQYDKIEMEGDTMTLYTVGRVLAWQDIPDSEDKYLLLQTSDNGTSFRYRVAFSQSSLSGGPTESTTSLFVEDVGWRFGGGQNKVTVIDQTQFPETGYLLAKQLIIPGDVVVASPLSAPPGYEKIDGAGVFWAGTLTMRRVGGYEAIKQEMGKK